MSCVWFCSDFHLTHKSMANRYRSYMGFKSVEEHDRYFIDQWKQHVSKRDIVWCLGDMAVTKEGFAMYHDLPGTKHLVLGNHDFDHDVDIIDFAMIFDQIQGLKKKYKSWLSHIPVHPEELYGHKNIHGHIHGAPPMGPDYFNCCPEFVIPRFNRPFVKLQEIYDYFDQQRTLEDSLDH